jgi:aspartate kinase
MSIHVVRLGGNNISKPEIIQSFLSIVTKAEYQQIVVISASERIQHVLISALDLLSASSKKHAEVIADLHQEAKQIVQLYRFTKINSFEDSLSLLQPLLQGIEYTGDYSLSLKDHVLSYAEILTTALLQDILIQHGQTSDFILPHQLGLIASNEYGNASIHKEASSKKIKSHNWGKLSLVPGSYGITTAGKIARLGERAADYTAAAIASILQVEQLELWEISKSFKTADDAIIRDAKYIENLTYAEASELAYFQHSSIHPRIVEPLTEQHIPIKIYELFQGKKQLKTTINSSNTNKNKTIKSVAHSDDIAIFKLNGPGVGFKPGILSIVTSAFAKHQINIRSVITAQTSINIIINKSDAVKAEAISQQLELPSVSQAEVVSNISLIAIVGHGMQTNHGISAQLFSAVAKHKINVLISGSGASDLVSYLVVDEQDKIKAIHEIHKIFFNN